MMNNAFYFILKAFLLLKLFSFFHFCLDLFGYVGKRLDKKAKENLKIFNVTNWSSTNYNKHIGRYLKK